jgi:competence protein ComEC
LARFGEVWVRRPVLWMLSAYITGLIASIRLKIEPFYIWISMIVVLLIALLYRKKALFPVLLVLMLLFGCFRGALFHKAENPLSQYIGQRITIQGTVTGTPQVEPDRAVYILDVSKVLVGEAVHPAEAKIKVSHYAGNNIPFARSSLNALTDEQSDQAPYVAGDMLQISGTIKEPTGPRNPKGFDYKGYLARRGIYSTMSVAGHNIRFIKKDKSFSLDRIFAWIRNKAEIALERSAGDREGELLKAVLLGERWLIEPQTEDDFSRAGLAHVLAVSGLHVGYVILLLSFLCSFFQLNRWATLIIQAVALTFYCVLAGAAPSVIRAVIMAVIYYTGNAIGRKSDILNSAGTAALLILLIKPMEFLESGFQLSFLAVCSIALFREPIRQRLTFLPQAVSSLTAATLSAQIGTLPLTAYHFNLLTPVSILTNLIVVPIIGLVVLGGFLILPFAIVIPGIAGILGSPIRLLCTLILYITRMAANLPYSYIRVISPSIAVILVFYTVLWLLSGERPGFVKRPYYLCLLLVAALLIGQLTVKLFEPEDLKIVFLDVGQGDCSLIQTPDGKNILIDGGGRNGPDVWNRGSQNEKETFSRYMAGSDVGEDTVVPFLLKNGVSSLDLVIMSHSHDDHIGGLIPVVEQINVKAFMEYPPGEESPAYQALKAIVRQKGVETISAQRGQFYRVGKDIGLSILYPEEKVVKALSKGNENNYSLVILMKYRDTSVLFTGDIEGAVENYLAGRVEEQAEILKVSHHGSNTSSTEAFLDRVSPNTGIIQVGTNPFGHPSPQTLDRLEERGIRVLRNDEHGAVLLHYRENQWSVRTMLNDKGE